MEKGVETSEKYEDRCKFTVQPRHEQLRIKVFWKAYTREIVPKSRCYCDKTVELFSFIFQYRGNVDGSSSWNCHGVT